MLKEKTNRKRLIWKIGNGIIIGLLAILFISYLYSPVHMKFNKKVDGEYLRYETEEHEAETDKVTINIIGELQREHRFSKKDVAFVGTVVVEFENYPDRNFELIDNRLWFQRSENDKSRYSYGFFGAFEKMYNCVDSIMVQTDKDGYHMVMYLNEDWENWENWMYAEGDRKEELMNIEETTARIKAFIE